VKRRWAVVAFAWVVLWMGGAAMIVHRTRQAMTEISEADGSNFWVSETLGSEGMAMQWLLRVPGAEGRFSRLVREGTPLVRVYGACGLYLVGSPELKAARARLASDDAEFKTGGCLRLPMTVRDAVSNLPKSCPNLKVPLRFWAVAELFRLFRVF